MWSEHHLERWKKVNPRGDGGSFRRDVEEGLLSSIRCAQCDKHSYSINEEGICYNCRIQNTWSKSEIGRCSECQEWLPINAEGFCTGCYYPEDEQKTICLKCEKPFSARNQIEWICDNCKPSCKGCGDKFNPKHKLDELCGSCYYMANTKAPCSSCGDFADLDRFAHCTNCSKDYSTSDGPEPCKVCKKRMTFKGICESCEETRINCPDCGSKMKSKYYICENCMDKRSTVQHAATKA